RIEGGRSTSAFESNVKPQTVKETSSFSHHSHDSVCYTKSMEKELTYPMVINFYRIRDGHFRSVDLASAKALERRGLVRIHRVFNKYGEEAKTARKYEILVPSLNH
ncbi:MAG: hypothetical protein ACO39X_07740, partial [Candidatus Nanopelagicaceae bacterium]